MKPVWIFGVQSVRALLSARPGAALEALVTADPRGPREEIWRLLEEKNIRRRETDPKRLTEICGSDAHQGVAVRAPLPAEAELEEVAARPPFLVAVLDGITDPHNLGAILRSAEAFGASGVVIPADRSAGLSSLAHKASAGAMEWLPVARVVNVARALRALKDLGYWVYAADMQGETELSKTEFAEKCALVIGSEGRGIRPGVEKEVDFRVRIAMAGKTESLNASVASGIMFYQAASGRNQGFVRKS